MKKYLLIFFAFLIYTTNVWAIDFNSLEASEGITKVLLKADTVSSYFLKPTKYGFYGSDKKLIFEIECEYASDFHQGYAKIKKEGKFGFVNTKGEFVIPAQYKTVSDLSEGLVAVGDTLEQFSKIVDLTNNVVATFEKKIVLAAKVNGEGTESGLILMTEDVYNYKFSEGLLNIENKFYDKSGKFKFSIPGNSSNCINGMILFSVIISSDGTPKYGYCDATGKPVIYPQYDAAEDFVRDRAVVGKKDKSLKFFEINRQGKILRFVTQK